MLIIKFCGKYICLNNLELGFAASISTIAILYLLELYRKEKKRSRISKCINSTLKFHGGDMFLCRFLIKRLETGIQY